MQVSYSVHIWWRWYFLTTRSDGQILHSHTSNGIAMCNIRSAVTRTIIKYSVHAVVPTCAPCLATCTAEPSLGSSLSLCHSLWSPRSASASWRKYWQDNRHNNHSTGSKQHYQQTLHMTKQRQLTVTYVTNKSVLTEQTSLRPVHRKSSQMFTQSFLICQSTHRSALSYLQFTYLLTISEKIDDGVLHIINTVNQPLNCLCYALLQQVRSAIPDINF